MDWGGLRKHFPVKMFFHFSCIFERLLRGIFLWSGEFLETQREIKKLRLFQTHES